MSYKTKFDGQTDTTIQLGDKNNPGKASVEGYYLGTKDTSDTGYGPGKLHIFQTKEGIVGVWGRTNSNRLMTKDHLGQMVKLTFTGMGEKKKGKNPAYNYTLQYDENNTTDVSGIDLSPGSEEELEDSEPINSQSSVDELYEDSSDDDSSLDEVQVQRALPPKKAATVTSDRVAKVQAMLSNRNK